MKLRFIRLKWPVLLFPATCILGMGVFGPTGLSQAADNLPVTSCNQYMPPKRMVYGAMVGQEDCLMQDAGLVDPDKKFHRIEMGISGTLSGFVPLGGRARLTQFTSAPDFYLTQWGNQSQRAHGILHYTAAMGNSLTLIYPEKGWNGKTFILVPGSGGSIQDGSLKSWDEVFNPAKPFVVDKNEKNLLDRGYAIIRHRRNGSRFATGDNDVILDDGTVWPNMMNSCSPELPVEQVRLVANFLKDRLGHKPAHNYWWGHSAGAYEGMVLNFMYYAVPNVNKEPDGKDTIDGIINDDPGGGVYVPIVMKNGKDILYRTDAEKATFVKTIQVIHQLYPYTYTDFEPSQMDVTQIPPFVSRYNMETKRTTLRVLKEKGLGTVYRHYEVRGVSHNGGENMEMPAGTHGEINILDLSRFTDAVFDLLDNWVDKGIAPPASRADAPFKETPYTSRGGWAYPREKPNVAGPGTSEGIEMPETACPLGVYYAWPAWHNSWSGEGLTGFAAFDGKSMEPFDGDVRFVDMNFDGKRDKRETVTEAWRRLGLLKPNETFNQDRYVACVQAAVAKLQKDKFITDKFAQEYIQEAKTKGRVGATGIESPPLGINRPRTKGGDAPADLTL